MEPDPLAAAGVGEAPHATHPLNTIVNTEKRMLLKQSGRLSSRVPLQKTPHLPRMRGQFFLDSGYSQMGFHIYRLTEGVLNYFRFPISNAMVVGMNNKINLIK
ncbi:MAG: hypothetical protein ACE5GI_08075 [Candidatus Aminicenantales bacterium]